MKVFEKHTLNIVNIIKIIFNRLELILLLQNISVLATLTESYFLD